MTRAEILADYRVSEFGVIQSPGKFEGEMIYAPHFYDLDMESGCPGDEIEVTEEDRKEFPELGTTTHIVIEECENGFVYLREIEEHRGAS